MNLDALTRKLLAARARVDEALSALADLEPMPEAEARIAREEAERFDALAKRVGSLPPTHPTGACDRLTPHGVRPEEAGSWYCGLKSEHEGKCQGYWVLPRERTSVIPPRRKDCGDHRCTSERCRPEAPRAMVSGDLYAAPWCQARAYWMPLGTHCSYIVNHDGPHSFR